MGFEVLRVAGDGDCFFHVAALHLLNSEEGIPPAWFFEAPPKDAGPWKPSYHRHIVKKSIQLRREVAEWAAKQLFGDTDFTKLLEATRVAQFHVIDSLPVPNFDVYPEGCFLVDAGQEIAAAWEKTEPPHYDDADQEETMRIDREEPEDERRVRENRRKRLAAFFVYWYSLSFSEIEGDNQWAARAAVFGLSNLPRKSIYGEINPNEDSRQVEAGIAPFILFVKHQLQLTVVTEDTGFRGSIELLEDVLGASENNGLAYILAGEHLHYDAIIWRNDDDELEGVNDRAFKTVDFGSSSSAVIPNFLSLNRGDEATQRSELMIGMGVWNINHLGKANKGKQATGPIQPFQTRQQPSRSAKASVGDKYKNTSADWEGDDGGHQQADDTKNKIKLYAVQQLVQNNLDWLDIFALNEVNTGIDRLQGVSNAKLYPGPHMVSMGPKSDIGQQEYYPLFILERPQRQFTINHIGYSAYFAGDDYRQDVKAYEDLVWMKTKNKAFRRNQMEAQRLREAESKKRQDKNRRKAARTDEPGEKIVYDFEKHPSFRPVVIHRLLIDEGKPSETNVNVGIVHTTPGGTEFERFMVYSQLEEFFKKAAAGLLDMKGSRTKNLWLVAGDYYLLDESLVKEERYIQAKDIERVQREIWEALAKLAKRFAETCETHANLPSALSQKALEYKNQASGEKKSTKRKRGGSESEIKADEATTRSEAAGDEMGKLRTNLKKLQSQLEKWKATDEDFGRCGEMLDFHEAFLGKLNLSISLLEDHRQWLRSGFVTIHEQSDMKMEEDDDDTVIAADDETEKDEYLSPKSFFKRNQALSRTLRHRLRNLIGITFQGQVSRWFDIIQTIWGTNIHTKAIVDPGGRGVEYTSFRIADFVVCSKEWKTRGIGLFDKGGKIVRVDDAALSTSLSWRSLSDHFPIGGRFSMVSQDYRVECVFLDDFDKEKRKAKMMLYLLDLNSQLPQDRHMREEIHATWWADGDVKTARDEEKNWDDNVRAYEHMFEVLQERIWNYFNERPDWGTKDADLQTFYQLSFHKSYPEDVFRAILPLAATLRPAQEISIVID